MDEQRIKGKKSSGMLVVCVRGKELRQIFLDGRNYRIGGEESDEGERLDIGSVLADEVQVSFEKAENGYVFRVTRGFERIWYNDEQIAPEHGTKLDITLDHQDVLRFDRPVDGAPHEQAFVIVYHSHSPENIKWRTIDLSGGAGELYISRHEELKSGRSEVTEELAEVPGRCARLAKEGDSWFAEDRSTMFGVFVNLKRVEGRRELRAMDVIRVGSALFLYQEDSLCYNHVDVSDNCLVINIEERSVWNLFRKHILLQDIELTVRPSEMVLILGGSGAGKTTFVNAVMGYEKARGRIMEGDIDVYENYNRMKYEIGFVPQQDLLRLEDTVYGTLENAAEMKMPRKTPKEEREVRINALLEMFGLEREKDSLVSKLSGGQRKRLSIAVEFVGDPSLFFLDEPDSGLDGVMARSLMEDLRAIADDDRMVLVITHSPDRGADLFDKVIVLAKGAEDNIGHLAFYGTPDEARQFFGTDTLEQIIRRINREDEGGEGLADQYIQKFRELRAGKEAER